MKLKDIFTLYVITGGKPQETAHSELEKSFIFLKYWTMLGNDPRAQGHILSQNIITAITTSATSITLPKPLQDIA
jgi:hypothetical protein